MNFDEFVTNNVLKRFSSNVLSYFISSFSVGTMKCWSKKRTLVYNHETGNSENQPGLETRVPGWGGTDSVDYLDPSWTAYLFGNLGAYMDPLITGKVIFLLIF